MYLFQQWISGLVQKIKIVTLIALFPTGYLLGSYHMAKFYNSPPMRMARAFSAGTESLIGKTSKTITPLFQPKK